MFFYVIGQAINRSTNIILNTKWKQNGITVAGGDKSGDGLNQLSHPQGLYIDDDKTIYVADYANNRIISWKPGGGCRW